MLKKCQKRPKNAQKTPILGLFYPFLPNFSAHFWYDKTDQNGQKLTKKPTFSDQKLVRP